MNVTNIDINVKGHVWHWAHSAPFQLGEWAMLLSPLPKDQQGNGQLNVTSALPMHADGVRWQHCKATGCCFPFHNTKVSISVLAHNSYCHNFTWVPRLQQTIGTTTVAWMGVFFGEITECNLDLFLAKREPPSPFSPLSFCFPVPLF